MGAYGTWTVSGWIVHFETGSGEARIPPNNTRKHEDEVIGFRIGRCGSALGRHGSVGT